ncbi:uncharacterized protein LOC141700577 [Apium graveolens]|uniref:uncharacterized protein LOC141700577 n=1 Tax=Apium graveolens TaxID=4045 RepID=UPI003D78E5EE
MGNNLIPRKCESFAKLEEKKGAWPEELAQVLWSYNTTPRTINGETPFSLVSGCEAMVPVEVGAGSFRRDNYDSKANEVNHRLYLDMIEETREDAQIRIAAYQQRTTRHYNSKVRARTFKVGDLVLRRSCQTLRWGVTESLEQIGKALTR